MTAIVRWVFASIIGIAYFILTALYFLGPFIIATRVLVFFDIELNASLTDDFILLLLMMGTSVWLMYEVFPPKKVWVDWFDRQFNKWS